jgi:Flp pilus assembly protein CpaB
MVVPMSTELPRTGDGFRNPVYRTGLVVLLVLVGLAPIGWVVLTVRQRPEVEMVELLVAAKDLPVGTMLTREDLAGEKIVKGKKVPRSELPPAFVTDREDLVDKKLSRPVRAGEPFDPQELNTRGAITTPPGLDMVSLQIGSSAVGFVGPGSRVDVLAAVRDGTKLRAFPLLVNMLVVAVDTHPIYRGGVPDPPLVSLPVTEKQALVLALAKGRGYSLEVVLRDPEKGPETDKDYDIDKLIKLLSVEVAPAPHPVGEPR